MRSSARLTGRQRKMRSPPPGESWVWITHGMLASDAWRALSLTGLRLVNFLLIEHMNHAATENGFLMATRDQLASFGLSRRLISGAIRELVFLGFVRVERGRLTRGGVKTPNLFRLTFFADKDFSPPTNEWKGVTREQITVWRSERTRAKRAPLREDIEVGPQSGSGKTAEVVNLTLVQGPLCGSGGGAKSGSEKMNFEQPGSTVL